jgi:hypothetical protein
MSNSAPLKKPIVLAVDTSGKVYQSQSPEIDVTDIKLSDVASDLAIAANLGAGKKVTIGTKASVKDDGSAKLLDNNVEVKTVTDGAGGDHAVVKSSGHVQAGEALTVGDNLLGAADFIADNSGIKALKDGAGAYHFKASVDSDSKGMLQTDKLEAFDPSEAFIIGAKQTAEIALSVAGQDTHIKGTSHLDEAITAKADMTFFDSTTAKLVAAKDGSLLAGASGAVQAKVYADGSESAIKLLDASAALQAKLSWNGSEAKLAMGPDWINASATGSASSFSVGNASNPQVKASAPDATHAKLEILNAAGAAAFSVNEAGTAQVGAGGTGIASIISSANGTTASITMNDGSSDNLVVDATGAMHGAAAGGGGGYQWSMSSAGALVNASSTQSQSFNNTNSSFTVTSAGVLTAASTSAIGAVTITDLPVGDPDAGRANIAGLAYYPTIDSHATSKHYVDARLQGLTWKDAVQAASTANMALSGSFSPRGPSDLVVDGYTVLDQDRLILKDQTDPTQNGIYVATVTTAGYSLDRALDANTEAEMKNATALVEDGTDNKWQSFTCSAASFTTSPGVLIVQISGPASILAGSGIEKSGNTISMKLDELAASGKSGLVISAAGAKLDSFQPVNQLAAGEVFAAGSALCVSGGKLVQAKATVPGTADNRQFFVGLALAGAAAVDAPASYAVGGWVPAALLGSPTYSEGTVLYVAPSGGALVDYDGLSAPCEVIKVGVWTAGGLAMMPQMMGRLTDFA